MDVSKEGDERLSQQEQCREFNKGLAVREQEEEMQKYASGEKGGVPSTASEYSAISSEKSQPIPSKRSNTSDNSLNLHSPPPSYFPELGTAQTFESTQKTTQPDNNVASLESSRSDYHHMPLKELRYESRRQLGLRLNLELPTVANWKSVADELGFSYLEIQNFVNAKNKTDDMLNEAVVRYPELTVGNLCEVLEGLSRQDIVTDLDKYFARDFRMLANPRRNFSSSSSASMLTCMSMLSPESSGFFQPSSPSIIQQETSPMSIPPVQEYKITTSKPEGNVQTEVQLQTTPSLPGYSSAEPDFPRGHYDAFVLFDVADKQFILEEFLPKIEDEAQIKLFIPERDLQAGANSYHAQLEAMINRCPKLVVILSDEFLRTPKSQWGLNVGVALDPAAKRRKIIPVIYKRITEMNILAGINACDRTRVLEDQWFWDSLVRSLKRSR